MAYTSEQMFKMKNELIELIDKKSNGKIKFKPKAESKFMKVLEKLAFWKKNFMLGTMVIGNTIYLSPRKWAVFNDQTGTLTSYSYQHLMSTMAHEFQHWQDAKNFKVPGLWTFLYLCPQMLGVVFALAALINWNPIFMVPACLLALPVPSPFRAWAEARGYKTDISLNYWFVKTTSHKYLMDTFAGWGYYLMWPYRKHTEKYFKTHVDNLIAGDIMKLSTWEKELFRKFFSGG